jgi:hypothetical protein
VRKKRRDPRTAGYGAVGDSDGEAVPIVTGGADVNRAVVVEDVATAASASAGSSTNGLASSDSPVVAGAGAGAGAGVPGDYGAIQ